jgi:uncharacterized membrane protein required for colicin V production
MQQLGMALLDVGNGGLDVLVGRGVGILRGFSAVSIILDLISGVSLRRGLSHSGTN